MTTEIVQDTAASAWVMTKRRPKLDAYKHVELTEWKRTDGASVYETIATFGEARPWCVSDPKRYLPKRWRFKTAEAAMARIDKRMPIEV